MTTVAVCTPRCGPSAWPYNDSMQDWLIWHHKYHPEIEIVSVRAERYLPIDVARNLLMRLFLETEAEWVWMLDQDAAWVPGTLDRLMSWDLPLVGALEMMRLPGACWPMALKDLRPDGKSYRNQGPEIYEFIGRHHDYLSNEPQMLETPPEDSLLETGFTGCHCLLVKREVIELMPQPWFEGYEPGGEDQYFCEKALAELGIKTFIDMSVIVGHASTDRIIGAFDFMTALRFYNELEKERQVDAAKLTEWREEE